MGAARCLLILQILACLLVVSVSGCRVISPWKSLCESYVGLNCCVDNGKWEPKLPPRDNTCCGPQCRYTALKPPTPPPRCGCEEKKCRCILDTSCGKGKPTLPFSYQCLTDSELTKKNAQRKLDGYAQLLSIDNWCNKTCMSKNFKCGINCCCREICPQSFCKFSTPPPKC
ncbi:hypothetical protein KR074_006885 [Drosophila pseudoananassae]|nr:hypothetical protein KR074_006885 [Drosophila pseudoananassae]